MVVASISTQYSQQMDNGQLGAYQKSLYNAIHIDIVVVSKSNARMMSSVHKAHMSHEEQSTKLK